jgi:hypothetical protein
MDTLSNTVEEIILRHDSRGMTRIRQHLESGYCQRAARLILDNRGVILIGTGFPVAGSFESDGPIGAIALYQVLLRLNYQPTMVCAPPISKIMSRSFETYELPIVGWNESKKVVQRALEKLKPALVISVERPGAAENGRYYNMHGEDITKFTAKFDLFFKYGNCPTIAFGDGGNEIGMGNVRDALTAMDIIPSTTTCDELVISTVSNWGVYGVIALMSHHLQKDLFALINPEAIANYLVENGCVDGVTRRQGLSEDGFPIAVGISMINQLRNHVFSEPKGAEGK